MGVGYRMHKTGYLIPDLRCIVQGKGPSLETGTKSLGVKMLS